MSNLYLVTLRKNLNVAPKVINKAVRSLYGKGIINKFDINIEAIINQSDFTLLLDEKGVDKLLKLVAKTNGNALTTPLTVIDNCQFLGGDRALVVVNSYNIYVHLNGCSVLVGHYYPDETEIYSGNVLHVLDQCVSDCVLALGIKSAHHYITIDMEEMQSGEFLTREEVGGY